MVVALAITRTSAHFLLEFVSDILSNFVEKLSYVKVLRITFIFQQG